MEDKNLRNDLKGLFLTESEKVAIYLRSSSKIKPEGYDSFRNTSFETENQNAIYIRAIVQSITADKLIMKEMGLVSIGAVSLLVKDNDADKLKLATKIIIKGEQYVTYNQALGSKFVVFKQRGMGLTKVILFRI